MSTRSFIAVPWMDQLCGIYCHYDGYPEHVGKLLVEFHNSSVGADTLVFGPQIRNIDNDGTVVRFGDGSPDDSEIYDTVDEALASVFDYAYVFSDNDNCWKCYSRRNGVVREIPIPGNTPWE